MDEIEKIELGNENKAQKHAAEQRNRSPNTRTTQWKLIEKCKEKRKRITGGWRVEAVKISRSRVVSPGKGLALRKIGRLRIAAESALARRAAKYPWARPVRKACVLRAENN